MKRPSITAADGSEEPSLLSTVPDDSEAPVRVPLSVEIQRLRIDLRTCRTRIIDLQQELEAWRHRLHESNREADRLRQLMDHRKGNHG